MSAYNPEDDNRLEDLPEIILDVDSSDYITDELYDLLCEAFVNKAKDMGYDVVNSPQLVLSDWTIKAKLAEI